MVSYRLRHMVANNSDYIEVYDDDGKPVRSEKGELVCTRPFPSMPIHF